MPPLAEFPSVLLSKPSYYVQNAADLDGLSAKLMSKPWLGARIEHLHVVLNNPFPLDALHQCLKHMPNITDLILLFLDPDIPALLDGVLLPKVQYFHTNVDHHLLPGFLASHPHITTLQLGECGIGQAQCPLEGTAADRLRGVSGPGKCVSHLVHTRLSRLTMELSDDPRTPSRILRSVPAPFISLYVLIIDFYPDEYDILDSIALVCKTVRKLKLLEKPSALVRRKTARRAWNNGIAWFNGLLRLPFLEQLMLRTAAPVLRGSRREGSEADERRTFMCWVNGVCSSRQRRQSKSHPMLYHIGVWYRAGEAGRSIVTHWSQALGEWRRSAVLVNPPVDYDFV